jgi:hypothetical protein
VLGQIGDHENVVGEVEPVDDVQLVSSSFAVRAFVNGCATAAGLPESSFQT